MRKTLTPQVSRAYNLANINGRCSVAELAPFPIKESWLMSNATICDTPAWVCDECGDEYEGADIAEHVRDPRRRHAEVAAINAVDAEIRRLFDGIDFGGIANREGCGTNFVRNYLAGRMDTAQV
jgi:hypothetical protein